MLRAELARTVGSFSLEVDLAVPLGSTLAVVGESGSGKTTLLRLLAGLLRPDRGRIAIEDETWFDANAGVERPAWRRGVGYVSQDYALFPHRSVARNVSYGLESQRIPSREIRQRVAAALEQFGIASLAERRPHQLSGGQQQRVALARALVLEPRLLLLDEPLSALDQKTRRGVRGELYRLLRRLSCVTLYVTHSPSEALILGDEIAVIEDGRIRQRGGAQELLRHPRSSYVADFMGMNLLRGPVVERLADGMVRVEAGGGMVVAPEVEGEGDLHLVVNPREIVISIDPPAGSAQNVFEGSIEEIVPEPPRGERLRIALATRPPLVAEVTAHSARALGLAPGRRVHAAFKATGVTAFR